MKYIIIFLILTSVFANAQQLEITYNLKHQTDSTDINSVKNYSKKLFIFEDKSIFIAENRIFNDSLAKAFKENRDLSVMNKKKSDASAEIIVLENNDNITKQYFRFGSEENYLILDSTVVKWEIIKEKQTINSLVCQLARTKFKGREYVAWFSLEYPMPIGPFKFKGLPGLIVKIEDTKKYISYELTSIKKHSKNFESILNINNEPKTVISWKQKTELMKRAFILPLNKIVMDAIDAESRERESRANDLKSKKLNNLIELSND